MRDAPEPIAPDPAVLITPELEPVAAAFFAAQALDPGGAQLCIYRHGVPVLDVWAGRDAANDRPFGAETLSVVMS